MLNFPSFFNAQVDAYEIEQSLRFNSADSARLYRTLAASQTRTYSFWYKYANLSGGNMYLFHHKNSGDTNYLGVRSGGSPSENQWQTLNQGASFTQIASSRTYRDPSAWQHVLWKCTSTNVTMYVNGVEFASAGGANTSLSGGTLEIGARGSTQYFGGYIAEFHLVDGSALDPDQFGESDNNGVWRPKRYTGSHGTNGVYLKFDPSATNGIGHDHSGNGNNFTPSGFDTTGAINIGYPQALTAGSGSVTNPSLAFDGNTGTEAVASSSTTITFTPPTPISFSTKLEFWTASGNGPGSNDQRYSFNGGAEVTCSGGEWTTVVNGSGTLTSLAIRNTLTAISRLNAVRVDNNIILSNSGAGNDVLSDTPTNNFATLNPLDSIGVTSNGNLQSTVVGTSPRGSAGTLAVSSGKWYLEVTMGSTTDNRLIVGIVDAGFDTLSSSSLPSDSTNSVFYFSLNGRSYIDGAAPTYGATFTTNDVIGIALNIDDDEITFYKNGTSQGTITSKTFSGYYKFSAFLGTSSGSGSFTVNFGQRAFEYTQPSGFNSWSTANLPAPTVKDGGSYFDTVTYSGATSGTAGAGTTQTVTGLGFSPDLVWIKNRSNGNSHGLFDQVRGAVNALRSDLTNAEATTNSSGALSAFNSNGFTLANGSSGSDQAILTHQSGYTYVAWNWLKGATQGFDIVTGTGGTAVNHNLGVAPDFVIFKYRNAVSDWNVYHKDATSTSQRLKLNSTAAVESTSASWTINSTNFAYGGGSNTWVAYCWAEVEGCSKFGSYTGNGDSGGDGTFVYLGFRPAFFMIKGPGGFDWYLFDNQRPGYNEKTYRLFPNLASPENVDQVGCDFVSNGVKLRFGNANVSSAVYYYAAFGENPFGGSGVSPATAR